LEKQVATAIIAPDVGTTVAHVAVAAWLVAEGETVRRGQPIAELQTDKAVVELESIAEGVLLKQVAQEGAEVVVGEVVAYVGAPGEIVAGLGGSGCGVTPRGRVVQNRERRSLAGSRKTESAAGRIGVTPGSDGLSLARPDETEPAFLLELYRKIVLIRQFEERVKFLFLEGIMPGTIHQYQGEEAVAVGVCAALDADDVITSTHRPHGHALAKGLTAESLLHELFGKASGCCGGKGGSMHVGDLDKGMAPAIAIVAGNVPLATGVALAFKMRGEPRVAVSFMGDGAINEGAFHEAVNMGAIWSLPVLYVVENNLYSASTPIRDMVALDKLSDRAAGYGIPGVTIDGNDVLGVYRTTREAADRARQGHGPTLIEAVTYRITGHSRRDPCNYQPKNERDQAREREPIIRFGAFLVSEGVADPAKLDGIRGDVDAEIEQAVQSAMAAPDPKPEDTLEDLFV
jgi:acetoin:2,6-dichlorophenolindophenol oxidoreductase subunit alpha